MRSQKVAEIAYEDGKLPAFSSVGCYPFFYLTNENNVLCPACANKEDMSDDIVDYDANWEDALLYCDDCNQYIDPAYITGDELEAARRGDDEEDGEEILATQF